MKRATIVELITFLFIILFLYTGISKFMEYNIATEQIALSPLLAPIAGFVAVFIPVAEIITSILLFFPKTRIHGLRASLALMIAFTGYVVYLLTYNDQLPCTCGGVLEQLSWPQHLILNISLILLAITAIRLSKRSFMASDKKSSLQPQV